MGSGTAGIQVGGGEFIVMGYVRGAFGIHGWVKIHADTECTDSLFGYPVWWLGKDGQWLSYRYEKGALHTKDLVAKLSGVNDRNCAEALRGNQIAIPRSQLPQTKEDEYYWADLIGLTVVNLAGEKLGSVARLLETGANDVLVVYDGNQDRLIPFIASCIHEVNLAAARIVVDWSADF